MDEGESPKELSSELTGLNKGEKEQRKKQLIIGISVGAVFIILLIIILIVALSGGSSDDDSSSLPTIGEINCEYDILSTEATIILGNEFNKNSDFDIYIDGTKIKYSKEYKFDSIGKHKVQFKLQNNINMDYMFKDVQDLISVEMISEQNCQILSMESTFENCYGLTDFNLTGFDGSNLKSMKKAFYRSELTNYHFDSFNTENLEDISYMLSTTSINEISLKGINTSKVINMSHLFESCSSSLEVDLSNLDTSSVKDMSYMFSSIGSIKDLDLSNFKTSQVVTMANMFQDCISLTYLHISNFDTSKVEDMSYMFDSCFALIV